MSPRRGALDAREEFIRRWRAKEAEADARCASSMIEGSTTHDLPPAPVPEPMQIEGGDAAAAREEARQLGTSFSH